MMPERINLNAVVEGMEMQWDDAHSYLHRPTGRVVTVSDDALAAAERDDDESMSLEELEDARQILEAGSAYVELPDRFEIDEYRIMERFARGIADAGARDAVLTALHGRGAFRYFKDTVHRLGLTKSWYAYREARYLDVARAWCDAHDIAYDESALPGA